MLLPSAKKILIIYKKSAVPFRVQQNFFANRSQMCNQSSFFLVNASSAPEIAKNPSTVTIPSEPVFGLVATLELLLEEEREEEEEELELL